VIPAYVHLRRAKDEIDRRFAEPLDVAALARTALASEAHFARSFRRAFGETPEQVKALVSKGAMGNGVFATDDCRRTYEELKARGVEFLQEPAERFYGIEATFRDNSGNWFSLTQRTEAAQGPA
jgi:AraC-like DNA-binding protein